MSVPSDISFTDSDLVSAGGMRTFFVQGAMPGSVTVVDDNGSVVLADQTERTQAGVVVGIDVDMTPFLVDGLLVGTWKIRHNRGARGSDSLSGTASDASTEEMLLYSMIFG